MKLSFLGEVMLGREVFEHYQQNKRPLVESKIIDICKNSNFVFANLEAPLSDEDHNITDIMTFVGNSEILREVKFINGFSLANNHINDIGEDGIDETIQLLENAGYVWNGFYEEYQPLVIEENKIAIICCTDILNKEIDENFHRKILWLDNPVINEVIAEYKSKEYTVILYVHGGIMFSRFPNPLFRDKIHTLIDRGADLVITVHPHCLGSMEYYKDVPIFYSLGDFIMDGHSDRRRYGSILEIELKQDKIQWNLIPTYIDRSLTTVLPKEKNTKKVLRSFNRISEEIANHSDNYTAYYKRNYKFEIIRHSISTLKYQIREYGIAHLFQLMLSRTKDFKNMARWIMKDTCTMRNNREDKSML